MTVRRRIGLTGTEPGAGRTALLVTVTRTAGAPRWNTSDGTRPTQAQVNRGLVPRIYRPVGLHVERTYKGERVPETLTGFAEGGAIGNDVMNSCAFGSPYRLTLGETRQTVTVGASYVIVLGDEIDGRITGPVVQPVISAIFYVPPGGGLVVGISGRLEVLPS